MNKYTKRGHTEGNITFNAPHLIRECQSQKSQWCSKETACTYGNGCYGYEGVGEDKNIALCHECFNWEFWNEHTKNFSENSVVIKGIKYHIGKEIKDKLHKISGHGGALFKIQFFDGRIIETTNLWFNGHVPKEFEKLLPDNAEFIIKPPNY